jgi:hypothetical protein
VSSASLVQLVRRISATLRERYPRSTSALVVGSYAHRRPFIDDIDVSLFDPSVEVNAEINDRLDDAGRIIDVAVRNPAWLTPARGAEGETLLRIRELRKVVSGIVLFDDCREVGEAIRFWRDYRIPLPRVLPFLQQIVPLDLAGLPAGEQRLAFDFGLENLLFGWLHLDMGLRFSKPKWLWWDVPQIRSAALQTLFGDVTCEAALHVDVPGAILELRPFAEREGSESGCARSLRDADFLRARGETEATVWPLRAAARDVARTAAATVEVPYRDLRSVGAAVRALARSQPRLAATLASILDPDRPLPRSWVELFEDARADFAEHIEQRRPATREEARHP